MLYRFRIFLDCSEGVADGRKFESNQDFVNLVKSEHCSVLRRNLHTGTETWEQTNISVYQQRFKDYAIQSSETREKLSEPA